MKGWLFRIALLVWVVAFALKTEAPAQPIKLMSFNVRFDGGNGNPSPSRDAWIAENGEHRRDLAVRVVQDFDPDILGVQEALTNQIEDLREALPQHDFYGVGRDDGHQAGEHCGIYYRKSRFQPLAKGSFWLNEQADTPGTRFPETCCARVASWLVLQENESPETQFLLINTHWDHQIQPAREFSAILIRERAEQLAEGRPLVILGDLNVTTDNPAFERLVKPSPGNPLQLIDSFRNRHPQPKPDEGTYHGFQGNTDGQRIDYILYTEQFTATDADILRFHQESRYPADHFPVVAILERGR